jgi:hypothetical protein
VFSYAPPPRLLSRTVKGTRTHRVTLICATVYSCCIPAEIFASEKNNTHESILLNLQLFTSSVQRRRKSHTEMFHLYVNSRILRSIPIYITTTKVPKGENLSRSSTRRYQEMRIREKNVFAGNGFLELSASRIINYDLKLCLSRVNRQERVSFSYACPKATYTSH